MYKALLVHFLGSEGYRIPHYVPRVYFKDYLPVTDTVMNNLPIMIKRISKELRH